jgi:formate dehydrogenase major subunit
VKAITLNIDNQEIQAKEGLSILEVARENNIYIPTLCYHPKTIEAGKCRICVIEVEGLRDLQASCSLKAKEGMIIKTNTERVIETRKMIIELYLANGAHNCISCEANGICELQKVAYHLGIEKSTFPTIEKHLPVDSSSPMIFRDMNKCIQCYRCIIGCNNIVVNEVLDMGFRGSEMTVICDTNKPMGKSSCVVCGECVHLCPTGALTEKKAIGKGRTWEVKKFRTTCPYCGVGCQIHLHVKDNEIIKVTGVENVEPNYGSLCIKGRFGYDFVHSLQRLQSPLLRKNGKLRKVTWDEALDFTAKRLLEIKKLTVLIQ